ncbi:MAG: DNA/RNA nuclease SfsA [Chloroflexi bacterium]|nr:DNA/RNA nuclease SfsA [Chloroflexota bacterium]
MAWIPREIVEASLVRRATRFSAFVKVDGSEELAHVPNSGRLKELFVPGRTVYLVPQAGAHRKTHYDLVLVDLGETLVSSDARLPSTLVYEAIASSALPQFRGYTAIKREPQTLHPTRGRLDLLLSNGSRRCLIEVKSITLVVDGAGLFPDSPTARGRRHVQSLLEAREAGYRAAIIFVVQREDAYSIHPNDEADPEFGIALRHAAKSGVEVYAYKCKVSKEEVRLAGELPVQLLS